MNGNITGEITVHSSIATKLLCIAYVTVQMERPLLVVRHAAAEIPAIS